MIGADCFDEMLVPCQTVTGWSMSAVLLIGGLAVAGVVMAVWRLRQRRR